MSKTSHSTLNRHKKYLNINEKRVKWTIHKKKWLDGIQKEKLKLILGSVKYLFCRVF